MGLRNSPFCWAAGAQRVFMGGLALDVCVRATALDARRHGFEVHLIEDATRPVDPAAGRAVLAELESAGVIVEGGGDGEGSS